MLAVRAGEGKLSLMSRRSRKRGNREGGGSKWLVAIVALLLVLVVAVGVVHMMIRRYLQSDEFRIFVSDKVSEAIHVEGDFKELQWDGLAVRSEGFEAQGNDQIRMINVEGVQTDIGLGGFWRGVWEVKGFQVRQVDLEIDARSGVPSVIQLEKKKKKDGWLPSEVEMQNLRIGHLSLKALLDAGPVEFKGARVDAQPGNGSQNYDIKISGGDLILPSEMIPKLRLDEADIRYKDRAVFVNRAEARFWERGRVELTGEWDPTLNIRGVQGQVSGVNCDQLVNEDWSKRLRGKLSTDFNVVWVADKPMVTGHLKLQDGVLTALPILDVLEAYLDTTRFRVLTLNVAETDWKWQEGRWSISNFVIASEGLMRLEGDMRVMGENIDGHFQLGLAPGIMASIPGAEEHVFLAGKNGLRWAPVRITGTLSEPKHDLTERLLAAAGRRLLEALPETAIETILLGKGVVDHSTKRALEQGFRNFGATDILENVFEHGMQGVEGAVDGVVDGVLRGLLDGGF